MERNQTNRWMRHALILVSALCTGTLEAGGPLHGAGAALWIVLMLVLFVASFMGIFVLTADAARKEEVRRALARTSLRKWVLMAVGIVAVFVVVGLFRNTWFFTRAPLWLFASVLAGPFVVLSLWFEWRHHQRSL